MFKEFRAFIARGNVIDLAVAVVIGAAFGKIVTSFVDDVLMPPIGVLLGKVDFSSLFFVLSDEKGMPQSIAQAKTMGVPVLAYGSFINSVINFLIIAFCVFLLVRAINRMKSKPEVAATTRDCPYCLSQIPVKAVRCGHCTSELRTS